MTVRNLHRIAGSAFEHAHPQCAFCTHFRPPRPLDTWEGHCVAKRKTLCCGRARRCETFEHATWRCASCGAEWTPAARDRPEWPVHCSAPMVAVLRD